MRRRKKEREDKKADGEYIYRGNDGQHDIRSIFTKSSECL